MSYIKRWFEDNIDKFSDDELREMGYTDNEIKELRYAFTGKTKRSK